MGRLALLLIVCVLLGRASCGTTTAVPQVTATASAAPQVTSTSTATASSGPESQPESTSASPHPEPTAAAETSGAGAAPQRDVTIDQVITELDGLYQSAGRAATAGPLAALTNALAGIQTSLAAMSSRLDVMQASQLELRQLHNSLEKRMDASQTEAFSRWDAVQTQLEDILTAVGRIPKAVLGEACSRDADCSRWLPEATCSASGVCTCRDGYRRVSDLHCRQRSLLDEVCLEDADCQMANTTCTNGRCSCDSGLWNYNSRECRRVAGVNMGGRCVGDQDCHSRLNHLCISNTCSCETRTDDGYEYRLVGGPSCSEGNVEVRRSGGSWGLVCDDSWSTPDAEVVCRSLGFRSGQAMIASQYGRGTDFLMDEVQCSGSEEHLVLCPYNGWGVHNCASGEVAGVRCQD